MAKSTDIIRNSTILRFVLVATLLVWLSAVAVFVPSSIALEQGILSGVLDGTLMAFPVLLLGLVFLWFRRQRNDPVETRISPLQAGLLGAWLFNAGVLGIVNALSLATIVGTGRHLGASAFIYVAVMFSWLLSAGAGVAGWGIAVILRDRREARGSKQVAGRQSS